MSTNDPTLPRTPLTYAGPILDGPHQHVAESYASPSSTFKMLTFEPKRDGKKLVEIEEHRYVWSPDERGWRLG